MAGKQDVWQLTDQNLEKNLFEDSLPVASTATALLCIYTGVGKWENRWAVECIKMH